jgi:cobalt-zinc-cadmium efflux system protein
MAGAAVNLIYVIVEATYGFAVGSISLVADASHNLSDVLGLLLAWGAVHLSGYSATRRKTYGMRRSTVLSALLNAVLLLGAVGGIAVEAVHRLLNPVPFNGTVVIVVAVVGIFVNGFTATLLAGSQHDLNARGAFLHMIADAAVSLGVAIAGMIYLATGWSSIDPVTSLIVAVVILVGTWGLLRESVHLALDGVPEGIDVANVSTYLSAIPGVTGAHDLHVWALSTTETALTVHLVKPDGQLDDALVCRIRTELHDQFGIEHVTVQLEANDCQTQCRIEN